MAANLMRFAGWGALWGLALGFGLLAPDLLVSHRLRPRTSFEWVLLDLGLGLVFAGGGAAISVPAMLLATDLLRLFGRGFRDWSWAVGLTTGPVLVVSYALIASLIGRYYVFASDSIGVKSAPAATEISVAVAVALVLHLVYRRLLNSETRPPAQLLAVVLAVATGLQVASLPAAAPVPPPVVGATPLADVTRSGSTPRPLLFIGLDGGSWAPIDALTASHELPTLEGLIARGIRGRMQGLWPPFWSSSAWAAVLTGYSREETGMYEDLSMESPGLPLFQAPLSMDYWFYPVLGVRRLLVETGVMQLRVPPRMALATPPFWETLALSGRQTAVVRLPYSYPADRQGGALVISDWVGHDWQVMGVSTRGTGPLAGPAEEVAPFLEPFEPSREVDDLMEREFFPRGIPALSPSGVAALENFRRGYRLDVQTLAAARDIARARPGSNVAIYLGGWDGANHALWRYQAGSGHPDRLTTDATALAGVLDHYLVFLDRSLRQLLAAFSAEPNVVIASDHGFSSGWHDEHALFLASGPDVVPVERFHNLSYFDVVPAVLDLQGLKRPASMRGRAPFIAGR